MESIKANEAVLLEVCKNKETTNDTRGRLLFELIVIRRCIASNLTQTKKSTLSGFPGLKQCKVVTRFTSHQLPNLPEDGLYVPVNTNFPAIDLVWKMPGKKIWCVQVVHVSTYPNVLADLEKMCKKAGWDGDIMLLYLSPEAAVSELKSVQKLVPPAPAPVKRQRRQGNDIATDKKAVKSVQLQPASAFACLADLQWPAGCSLPSNTSTTETMNAKKGERK